MSAASMDDVDTEYVNDFVIDDVQTEYVNDFLIDDVDTKYVNDFWIDDGCVAIMIDEYVIWNVSCEDVVLFQANCGGYMTKIDQRMSSYVLTEIDYDLSNDWNSCFAN